MAVFDHPVLDRSTGIEFAYCNGHNHFFNSLHKRELTNTWIVRTTIGSLSDR